MTAPKPTPPKQNLLKKQPSESSRALIRQIGDLNEQVYQALKVTPDAPKANLDEAQKVRRETAEAVKPTPSKKRPIRKSEHLTQSPFRDHDALKALHESMKDKEPDKTPVKRNPQRKPKSQEK